MSSAIGSNTNSPVPFPSSSSPYNHPSRPASSLSSNFTTHSTHLPPPSPSKRSESRQGQWRTQGEGSQASSIRNGRDGAEEMNGCIESNYENQNQQEVTSNGPGYQLASHHSQDHPSPFLHLPYSSVATPRSVSQAPSSPALVSPHPSRALASSPPPSHSHTPSTRGPAAFDFDDLLGPRPSNHVAQASSSSTTSQPASSDEGHHEQQESRALEGKLQGLGFASPAGGRVTGVGEFRDAYFDEGEETDESWLNYSSSSRRGGSRHHDGGTSTTSHHPSSSNTSNSPPSHISSPPNPSANTFGSPLSPHVAPFSPGLVAIGKEQPENANEKNGSSSSASNPWATPSANLIAAARAGAREREASWNSANLSSPPSESRAFASPALHATFATTTTTESHTSSNRSYSPFLSSPPLSHRYLTSDANTLPFPHPSNMPFTPPSSHPESFDSPLQHQPTVSAAMSQKGSRDTLLRSPEKGGYARAPYSLQPTLTQVPTLASNGIGGGGGEQLASNEEISTLFVTGFPDDMLEREFQNVFLFAEGFEAATLKIHSSALSGGDGSEGSGSGVNSARTSFEEYGREEFLRREACASPASNGNGMNGGASGIGGIGGVAGKKQSIGFARFRTRQHAIEAMEVLNRRKVDLERGSILKAEMAKKNLHPKKQVFVIPSPAPITSLPPCSSFESNLVSATSIPSSINGSAPTSTAGTAIPITTIPGGGPSIPLSALDADTLQRLANSGNVNPAVLAEIARQNAAAVAATSPKLSAPVSTSTNLSAYDAFHSVPSIPLARRDHQYFDDQPSPLLSQESNNQYPSSSSSTLPLSSSPPRQSNLLSQNSLLQQFDDRSVIDRPVEQLYSRPLQTDNYSNPSPLLSSDIGAFSSTPRERQASYPQQATSPGLGYGSTFSSQLVPAAVRPQTQAQQQSSQLALQQAQLAAAQAYARNQNPADMNSPKNTLYVGGLPAVLPSLTGPFSASHLEDSLRNAFSRCPGFKRLQFRSKSNGPIVFVEFEDTAYATKAMNEMYGYTLGGLVKGGIRLSYSKNPLGVRSNGLPSGNPPPLAFVSAGQIDGTHHAVVYPSYVVPYSTIASSPSLVEVRRHPDPFYGASGYNHAATSAHQTPNPNVQQSSLDYRPHSSSSLTAAYSTTPQTQYTSTFSPFNSEY